MQFLLDNFFAIVRTAMERVGSLLGLVLPHRRTKNASCRMRRLQQIKFTFFTLCAVACLMAANVEAGITIQFDYEYDSTGFFAEGTEARETLQWVGKFYSCLLDDDLLEIDSADNNSFIAKFWQPNAADVQTSTSNFDVAADTITVYAGAQAMSGDYEYVLAWSGPGWYSFSDGTSYAFKKSSISRGEGSGQIADVQGTTAYEVGIWGGSVSVNTDFNWNEDHALLAVSGEYDLTSVLLHEFCHTLGFGTLDSWDNLISGTTFTGTKATAANGGTAPSLRAADNSLGDTGHWSVATSDSTIWGTDSSQRTIMEPYIAPGEDLWTTTLDIAALDDIGWDINPIDIWAGASGDTFSATSSWSTSVSPGWRDSIQFDSSTTQTVLFTQDAQIMQAAFSSGQTTWSLDGHTVETDLLWTTGSGTSLQVQGGKLQVAVMATVGSGSSVTVDTAGQIELLDSTLNGSLTVNAGGELLGAGVVTGTLYHQANGAVSPGGSGQVGLFTIEDDYQQADDAVLQIDLFDLSDYDSLAVDGNVSLAGDLVVSFDSAFTMSEGDVFTILTCGSLTGEFGSLLGDLVYGDLELEVLYDYTADTVSLVAQSSLLPGDANRDGKVDGSDVTILAGNWQAGVDGSGGVTWDMGDFNGDGKVDGSDVTILAGNWQAGVETTASAVPEPPIIGLLLLLISSGLLRRDKFIA